MTICPCCGQPLPGNPIPLWDAGKRLVRYNGREVRLTLHEAALFGYLYENAPDLCSHQAIQMKVWGLLDVDAGNCLSVLAHKLRKKIAPLGIIIENLPNWQGEGGGYWMTWQ